VTLRPGRALFPRCVPGVTTAIFAILLRSRVALAAVANMPLLPLHTDAKIVRVQLRQNLALRHLSAAQWQELEPLLEVEDYPKSHTLEHQGAHSMEQYFILDGILKRVVSNAEGKEMILRFAAETDIDTSYAAWRLKTPIPYSIRTVTRVRAAKLSMQHWISFLERHPLVKSEFDLEIMKLMSEVMAHTITLHLLDASGRLQRFMRKHADLAERVPKKELASYLNLSPETLSRLKRRDKS
jgi:CRP/FNR family transcriptional regulator, dissimilatory nitrate respiration regulator